MFYFVFVCVSIYVFECVCVREAQKISSLTTSYLEAAKERAGGRGGSMRGLILETSTQPNHPIAQCAVCEWFFFRRKLAYALLLTLQSFKFG